MPWFKVSDSFGTHPKVLSIPRDVRPAAIGTWLIAGTWSASHLTDGSVPAHMLEELGLPVDGALALVQAKLWLKVRGGFQFKNWDEYQPTRVQVEAARESERKRKARQRGHHPESDERPAGSPASVPAGHQRDKRGSPDTPSRPVPSRPVPSRPDPSRPDQDSYVRQFPYVPDRASSTDDWTDEGSAHGSNAYWPGLGITNPSRVVALLVQETGRPITEDQAVGIVAGIRAKATETIKDGQRYIESAIKRSWAEIQQEWDTDPLRAQRVAAGIEPPPLEGLAS